jgi:uncharacterized protein YkwD
MIGPRIEFRKLAGLLALPAALLMLSGAGAPGAAALAVQDDEEEEALQAAPRGGLAPQSAEAAKTEAGILAQVNEIRRKRGQPELRLNERVADVARTYSRRMLKEDFFSHVSPKGDTPGTRLKQAGLQFMAVGENLYRARNIAHERIPTTSTEWWMGSNAHRATLLSADYRETGIGVWEEGEQIYVTQVFYRKLPRPKKR